ncbi:MAG: hypothetical protein KME42_15610 [Tildeniella nuda ZEHNDER 1965/U140]|jgi:hypothetical protein|nr:hypothetical protein [Tildeniella nuda ZEHNDER 1965/U140]
MPNYSRSTLILPNEPPACKTDAEDAPPFVWDTVQRTVIKVVEPLLCQQAIAIPAHSQAALVAMQRLVAMINTLRSSPLASLDRASERLLSEAQTLEALLPYVSEEAYDVLEALRDEERHLKAAMGGQPSAVTSLHLLTPSSLSSPHPFIAIDTLIPSLLWALARSSYSAMQLIEGVRAKCWQPEPGWSCGMLRLVVMLEAETPSARWCFDLATGYSAEKLLALDAIVQTDECILPLRQTAAAGDRNGSIDAAYQVDHQLTAIVQSLQAERFRLKTLLQGVAVELLQPGSGWQTGNLRLRLGFTFSTQTLTASSQEEVPMHPELIEAELMEEAIGITQGRPSPVSATPLTRTIAVMAKTHVSVVNPVSRALSPTTLVRVTDADHLEHYTQRLTQQQLVQSLVQLQSQQTNGDDESVQLTLIVQAAIACAHQLSTPGTGLWQPMLLMDELVPQLLWSLTSSTYEIMQLLGGIPAQVLQPNANWQQGTLRLLAALHLKATDVDYTLDLSTGRSVLINTTQLASDAIVHTRNTVCSQPTSIATLIAHLEQQLDDAMLSYSLLRGGVAIAWLEDVEQDWQTGSMQISLSLAFVADAL